MFSSDMMRNLERSEMAEQSIAPKSRIGRFLMVMFTCRDIGESWRYIAEARTD